MFLLWRKKIKLRYYLDMKKKAHGAPVGYTTTTAQNKKKRFSDDFGLRSPVVQKKKIERKSTASICRSTLRRSGGRPWGEAPWQ